jgi:hypothetical protein
MRDALLNWPARVAGVIAAELGVEPHLLQTILQQHINELLTEAADRFDPPGIGGERKPHAEHVRRRAGAMLRPPPDHAYPNGRNSTASGQPCVVGTCPWRTGRTPYLRDVMDALSPCIRRGGLCS